MSYQRSHLFPMLRKKLRRRMLKYQSKLFLFLDYDGIPWNNNYDEHAVKPLPDIEE